MKTFEYQGRNIKPIMTLGEDVNTNELVLCAQDKITPKMICYLFLTFASLNGMSPEMFAPLLIRGANHLLEEEPDLPEKIRGQS